MNSLHQRAKKVASIILATLFASLHLAAAQPPTRLHGRTLDAAAHPIAHATVAIEGKRGERTTHSDDTGNFVLDYPNSSGPLAIHAFTSTMESDPQRLDATRTPQQIDLILHPTAVAQQVTVTATRSSLDLPATANTMYELTPADLQTYPALALDDRLRQQAGFELFRRSSSHIQNPTSQGISLRGLGSTAASRTLVLEESVPMNDPFGGWIHWDEIPSYAIDSVTIATGGGSDLYGSSALGGVIDIVPAHPTAALFDATAVAGAQDTSLLATRADLAYKSWRQLLAADTFRTAGYIPTAPDLAGPVDVPANVHYQSGRSETDRVFSNSSRAFLIGNLLNEAHGNGTPLTTNATRLWRYIGGGDWSSHDRYSGRLRLFGSDEHYRQSFSSVTHARNSEVLTRLQLVRTQELGASTDAAVALSPIAFVAGADVRDIHATDNETPISSGQPSGVADTSARQRFIGGFGEALAAPRSGPLNRFSIALSLRLDSAANLDARTIAQPNSLPQPTHTPNRGEFIASPRLGVVRQVGSFATIHASVFRAFRTPTMNELYRTGQVGAQVTLANAQLQSERATGWETGATLSTNPVTLSATYFWTAINRPVSTVLLSTNLYMRENLGQIVSRGTELHLDLYPRRPISASIGYQYAHAIVTRFSAQPSLVGNWIPEVPRQNFTAQLRAASPHLGELTLAARASGHSWDDSANTFQLNPFFQLDLFARHSFGPHWSASLILNNLLNQRPDVSRTTILTLGSPFLAQGSLAFHWNGLSPR